MDQIDGMGASRGLSSLLSRNVGKSEEKIVNARPNKIFRLVGPLATVASVRVICLSPRLTVVCIFLC